MGTHPIFESDFDCLTDGNRASIWLTLVSTDLDALAVSSPVPLWDVRMLTLWPSMTPSSIWTTWYTCTNMTQLTESSTELSKPLTASQSLFSLAATQLRSSGDQPVLTTLSNLLAFSLQPKRLPLTCKVALNELLFPPRLLMPLCSLLVLTKTNTITL